MYGTNHFGVIDYLIVIGSLVICLLVGVYYAYFSKQTNEELLVGNRRMRIFPISASIMVSFFSAITVLGYPAEIYSFGIEIYLQSLFQGVGIVISAYYVIPFLYPMRLTSIYQYLELRYESLTMRRIGAFLFILEQLSLAGFLLYAPSIALESFLGLPMWISVIGIGLCGTMYTSMGGLKAVVWTDVFQFAIMLVALSGIVVKGFIDVGGVSEAFSLAYQNGRLKMFNFTVDPFMRHNFLNFVLGSGLIYSIRTGIHQVQVQRYMSLPNVTNASRAVAISVPFKLFVMALMVLTGIALYAANAGCDPVLSNKITKLDQLVTLFVVEKLAFIPGTVGLFTACVFSAVLSSLSSMLNSLAAVTWEDYLSRMTYFASMGPKSQTNVSRALSFGYGLIAMVLAFTVQYMGSMYIASYAITGTVTGAICAIFSMGLFMPFVNKIGVTVGVVTGLISVSTITIMALVYKPPKYPLPVSVENCTMSGFASFNQTSTIISPLEFPEKLYALSYNIYPFVGLVVSTLTGTIVSLVTGDEVYSIVLIIIDYRAGLVPRIILQNYSTIGLISFTKSQLRKVNPKYIHPFVRKFMHLPQRETNFEKELECLNK